MDDIGYKDHGGDVYGSEITHDFSINVNPLGLPEKVRRVLRESVEGWSRYPDPECRELVRGLSRCHRVPAEAIVCGNGAADLLYRFVQTQGPKRTLIPVPTFSEYERAVRAVGGEVRYYVLREEEEYRLDVDGLIRRLDGVGLLFLCNPNNPTGLALPKGELEKLATVCRQRGVFLVLDECFCDFLQEPEAYSFIKSVGRYPNVMVLRAFTKTYAMAGLRLGYGVCGDVCLADELRRVGQPWSVSLPAQEAGAAALDEKEYLVRTRALIGRERERLGRGLEELGFWVFPSQVNFLLFKDRTEKGRNDWWSLCRERKILIRDCGNFPGLGLNAGYYRICVRQEAENQYLLEQMADLLPNHRNHSNS